MYLRTKPYLQVSKLSALSTLAQDYLQLRLLDVQQNLLNDTVAAYQKSLKLTQNQYTVGVAAQSDVTQAQTPLKVSAGAGQRRAAFAVGTRNCTTHRTGGVQFLHSTGTAGGGAANHPDRGAVSIPGAPPRPHRRRASGGSRQRPDRCG